MVALETGNALIVSCIICRTNCHSILACPYLQGAQEFAKNASYAPRASNRSRRHSKSKKRTTSPKQQVVASTIITPEFAGNASSALEAHSPLQLDAGFRLNTDTGATAHMTPHKHWLRNYSPLRVPVKLANGEIVYSEGVGSLPFKPLVDGVWMRSVEFTRVLHVPLLRSNLLSILYLARVHHWHCNIDETALRFMKGSQTTHFMATIDQNNAAFLDGHVEEATEHSPQLSSTIQALPLTTALWHSRFAHHSHAAVKKLVSGSMVNGLELVAQPRPDPVCVEGTILTHTHLSLISGRFSALVLLFLSISRLHCYICTVPQSHIHIFSIFSSHYHIYCVHCSSLLYSRYSVQSPRLVRPVLWSCSI